MGFSSSNFNYKTVRGAASLQAPYQNPQYYVGNAASVALGNGDGLSVGNPCLVSNVWAKIVGVVGPVINMLDGTYTGANSMIAPTAGLSGISDQPITIKAINEGSVFIDGQGARQPINLNNNSYWIIQGMNATVGQTNLGATNSSVVDITGGTQVIVRRVCAWDVTMTYNNRVFSASGTATYITFEDCAGWGSGRKIFESSQGPSNITCRRCWARWEGSIQQGPKMPFEGAYNSHDLLFENCIATWSGELVPASYELVNNGLALGQFFSSNLPENPYDMMHSEAYADGSKLTDNVTHLGCISYRVAAALNDTAPNQWYLQSSTDSIHYKDMVAYFGPGRGTGKRGFLLCDAGGSCVVNVATNVSAANMISFGNAVANVYSPAWTGGNRQSAASPAAFYVGTGRDGINPESLYNPSNLTTRGPEIRYRYVNGVLTGTALWPWPMSARILAATTSSGHTPADIDAEIQAMFGTFI